MGKFILIWGHKIDTKKDKLKILESVNTNIKY